MPKIFLDAGHGGKDPGAVGNGFRECDLALAITLKLGVYLEQDGRFQTMYARKSDVFVEINERSRMANLWGADFFFSVHLNSFSDPNAHGVEALDFNGSGLGYRVANTVCERLTKRFKLRNRGVIHTQNNFGVIRDTHMPSIITEACFISNKEDIHKFDESHEQEALAYEYYAAICEAFGFNVRVPDKSTTSTAPKPAYDHGKALAYGAQSAGIISSPEYWEAVIKGKKVPTPDNVRQLFRNFVSVCCVVKPLRFGEEVKMPFRYSDPSLVYFMYMVGALNDRYYWLCVLGVAEGKQAPKAEYVQYLFENMLKVVK